MYAIYLVSFASIIELRIFEALSKSLTYTRNRSGPTTEPCGTPHVTVKNPVLLSSSI